MDALEHEDGSRIKLGVSGEALTLSMQGATSPATPEISLTLAEVEALQKRLGVLAATLRGVRAKWVG